jgi:hypothetical protein
MTFLKKIFRSKLFLMILFFLAVLTALSFDYDRPELSEVVRGVSFSKFHSDELGLDWIKTYLAILDNLGVKNLRLSAHWPMVEPSRGKYNFSELDYQLNEAKKRDISVILAVGRRLPGWPECHVPNWAKPLSNEERQGRILAMIEAVVKRYKNYPNIKYWQVENEPFLTFFSHFNCGDLDEDFLKKEINLVKFLNPSGKIMVTDSGEFGTWFGAYQAGDVFGTSQYLYIWNKKFNLPLRYPIGPWFFNIKKNLVKIFFEDKPIVAIEISSEPWLLQPIIETPLEVQFKRMDFDKFNEMINLANDSGFDEQYFWGAEWWYWLRERGYPGLWNRAKEIF